MSHELTIRQSGKVEMAYADETPWHGLGQKLDQNASIEDWRVAAGMDWEIIDTPLVFLDREGEQHNFAGKRVLMRSDDKAPLSVVSDRYKVVQPAEVLDYFRDLVESQGFTMHTAGTLFGGKKFWGLAKMSEERFVKNNQDGIGGYVLLCTSCDGSLSTTAKFTSIAVVCNNTLSYSLRDKRNEVRTTHGAKFDAANVKAQLGLAREEYDSMMDMAEQLANTQITLDQADDFVKFLFANTRLNTGKAIVEESKAYKKIISLYQGEGMGADLRTREGTAWGMLNAVTEYIDHHVACRTPDKRMNDAWFGWGAGVKKAAAERLLELV